MASPRSHAPFLGLWLHLLAWLGAACGPPPAAPLSAPPPAPPGPDLVVEGGPFGPPGAGQPFRGFIADRATMHGYLYNGDDLFPKQVNLCARGRSALLDLDLGPGASHELGLLGSAWEAHLTAVALDRDPERPLHGGGRTRFLYAWPVVSTAQLDRLLEAFALGRSAQEGGKRWDATAELQRRTGLQEVRPRLERSSTREATGDDGVARAQAIRWSRALMGAILERLWFSAAALPPTGLGMTTRDRSAYEALVAPFFELTEDSAGRLRRFVEALETGAGQAGLLFDSRRFRRFHEEVLLADLGPAWRHGRVTLDQLQAVLAQLETGEGRAPHRQALLQAAHRERARLKLVLEGREEPGIDEARRHHGAWALDRDRQAYLALKRAVDEARGRLSAIARSHFTAAIRRRLHEALDAGDDPLAAGSFYFETEHLLETTSGFTHAGILKRLRDPEGGRLRLWMFDRVLGFHYAYPVVKLAHSVPVEVLALSRARLAGRRYHWVRLRIPASLRLGGGQVSDRVTLQNLFTHLKEQLQGCPALTLMPGFYYSAISWITAHPINRLVLGDLWVPRVHTGYGYRSLHPDRLQALKGRTLRLPVRLVAGAPWTDRCPRRLPGAPVQP